MWQMKPMTQIESLWTSLGARSSRAPSVLRVDEGHPLDLYACINSEGKPILILVSPCPPTSVPRYNALQLTSNQKADGNWAITLALIRSEFAPFFALVCQDLIDASRAVAIENGADFFVRRLDRWRRLMEGARGKMLSEKELRGLLG